MSGPVVVSLALEEVVDGSVERTPKNLELDLLVFGRRLRIDVRVRSIVAKFGQPGIDLTSRPVSPLSQGDGKSLATKAPQVRLLTSLRL